MKHVLASAAALIAALAVPALAQTTIPTLQTSASAGEQAVITYFIEDSVGDVQLGQLGLRNGRNARVRALAQTMVRDHTRTADDGRTVGRVLGVDGQMEVPAEAQVALSHLARYTGARFDREWTKQVVEAHKTDLGIARDALEFAATPAVRSYLQSSIATNTRHLRMAEAAQTVVGTAD